jgi:HEAT repeat protein
MSIRYLAGSLHVVCLLLCGCGGDRVSKLVAELSDTDASVRRTAVHAVAEQPVGDERVVTALAQCVAGNDAEVRYFATDALGRIGPAAKSSVPALKLALQDPEPRVRLRAALSMARINPQERSFMPTIVSSMREGDGKTLLEIGAMGPSAVWAVPALVELLGNPLPQVRVLAANDLGHIGPGASSALPALRGALQDANPAVKRAAEEASKRIHPPTRGG